MWGNRYVKWSRELNPVGFAHVGLVGVIHILFRGFAANLLLFIRAQPMIPGAKTRQLLPGLTKERRG